MHTILTFITVVKPDRVDALEEFLAEIQTFSPAGQHPLLPLAQLKSLHFGSLTIFHDPAGNYDPYLVFEHNFDGEMDEYLEDLYQKSAEGLHKIYSHCFDYTATGASDFHGILSYMRAHLVRPDAYHIGNVGRSAQRIKEEKELRDGVEIFLDGASGRLTHESPAVIRHEIQEYVKRTYPWTWISTLPPRMTFMQKFVPWAKLVGTGLLALVLLPVLFPFIIVFLIILRQREKTDRSQIPAPQQERVEKLMEREDRIIQNHMASLCYVKPGLFRRTTLRSVLWLTNMVARVSYKGKLSGLTTLHFAHWALLDEGRRLLFLTNYDGSWENYLDDFIDKSALGLTGIWSNTDDFPRTRFLLFGGARDATRFKAIARHTQAYTNVWYSAYPGLTVHSIDNNSAVREGLFKSMNEAATRRWLWRF